MPEIIVKRGEKELSRIPVHIPEITIGRADTNKIIIVSSVVSRRHARIVQRDKDYWLEDLGSSSGSFVAGKRVTSYLLQHGDAIRIGEYDLLFLQDPETKPIQKAGKQAADAADAEAPAQEPESQVVGSAPGARPEGVTLLGITSTSARMPTPAAKEAEPADGPASVSISAPASSSGGSTSVSDDDEWTQEGPPPAGEEEERLRSAAIVFNLTKEDIQGALLGKAHSKSAATEQKSDRLTALFEISQALETAKDFSGVLKTIMDKAVSIMGAERGFLMLEDPETKDLRVHVARDASGDITGVDAEKVSRSLMQRVRETGKPVLIMHAQSAEWGTKSVMEHSIHSALCAPLMTRDLVTGVIYVDHRSSAMAFTKEDVAFFTTFALQAKAAIDNSRAYWELVDGLFRASNDFIVVCSPTGKINQVNLAGANMLESTEEAIASKNLEDFVTPRERGSAELMCRETISTGVVSGSELILVATDGREVPLSVSSFTLRDRSGRALGICVIGRDLTDLKALIGELTEAKDNLEIRNRFIRTVFGRYLSDEIVANVLESPEGLELGGAGRKVTILMSDVRGFTAVSERLQPDQVVAMLNNYLGAMAKIIMKYQGTIDEFIGDSILAIFGAPITREDDALRAAACAVEMQLAMDAVNESNQALGLPEIEMGIGLNTGEVVVGNIGSPERMKYGVVGSHVNLTSRIETYTVGGQILISGATLADAGADHLKVGGKQPVRAKGFKEPITVYELRGVSGKYNAQMPESSDDLRPITPTIALRFTVIEGKHMSNVFHDGELVRLSESSAEIRSKNLIPPLHNLKILLGTDLDPTEGDIYAKVVERRGPAPVEGAPVPEPESFIVRFTSLPPKIEAHLASVLQANRPLTKDGASSEHPIPS